MAFTNWGGLPGGIPNLPGRDWNDEMSHAEFISASLVLEDKIPNQVRNDVLSHKRDSNPARAGRNDEMVMLNSFQHPMLYVTGRNDFYNLFLVDYQNGELISELMNC